MLSVATAWGAAVPELGAHTGIREEACKAQELLALPQVSSIPTTISFKSDSQTALVVPEKLNPQATAIVSVAILSTSSASQTKQGSGEMHLQNHEWTEIMSGGLGARKDCKLARLAAFIEAWTEGRNKYFDDWDSQVYLRAIATQPKYQHRYCVKVVMENGLAVLALASPSGYIFFFWVGICRCWPYCCQGRRGVGGSGA